VHVLLHLVDKLTRELLRLFRIRPVAADAVDCAVSRGCDQPADGIGRLAVAGPAFGGSRKRVLRSLPCELAVAEKPHEGGHYASPFVTEDVLEHAAIPPRGSAAPRSCRRPASSPGSRRRPRVPRPGSLPRSRSGRRGIPCCRRTAHRSGV